jgi:hypothetical protein
MLKTKLVCWRIPLATAICCCGSVHATDWLQFGFDQRHSGNNTAETTLSASNVASMQQVYSVSFVGTDGPTVFLSGVDTGTGGPRDLLFATTLNGIAAIDSATGATVWVQSAGQFEYSDGAGPVIDPNRKYVYGPASNGRIRKLLIGTGVEVTDQNWPVVSSLKPADEKAAAPLTIGTTAGGTSYLYSATSSFYDVGDYQGHVTTINLATGTSKVWNAACSNLLIHFVAGGTPGVNNCGNLKSGIWGRGGPTYDPDTGRVYFTTANGVFDANANWGESVIALNADGSAGSNGVPLDSYTPTEYGTLNTLDEDLGSGAVAILPVVAASVPHLGVQVGKDSIVRLLNLDNLSGAGHPGAIGGELQKVPLVASGFDDWATPHPAAWKAPDGSVWVFAQGQGVLAGLQVTVNAGQPALVKQWSTLSMSLYASSVIANGVLYAVTGGTSNATIQAINPTTGAVLWKSPQIPGCCHTQSPIVVNGRLYVVSSSTVTAFQTGFIFHSGFGG